MLAAIAIHIDSTNFVKASAQPLTMVPIWLGLAKILSVVCPLRVEPLTARLRNGTCKAYLVSRWWSPTSSA